MRRTRTSSRESAGPVVRLWLAGALLGVATLTLTAPDVARAGPKIVVAPKSGQKLDRSPVTVTVRAAWKVRKLRVSLNGHSVSREFRRARIGKRNRRTVRLSASHGLRYGRNVVRVTKKRFARKRKRDRVRFTVTRDRPLVGAGRDRRVEVGRTVRLNGHASRRRDAPRRGAKRKRNPPGSPAGLKMRWRLARKPAGSEAKIRGRARGIQPPTRRLAKQRGPVPQPSRPRLKNLDKPGRYVAKLVVADRGVRSVADRVVTTAIVGTPLVPVDTAATVRGERGIAIGYHPAQEGGRAPDGPNERFLALGEGNLLQLVVLDRRSLETVETWAGPASDESIATLTTKLKQYEDNRLAIVTAWCHAECDQWWESHVSGATQKLVNTPGQGVNRIGASRLTPAEIRIFGVDGGGQLSWIGVPGFPSGQAWEVGGLPFSGGVPASLDGFLSPDSNDNYAYVGRSPTTYDLGPDGQSVSMTIGPSRFSGSLPSGQGGFLVAYLVGTTLRPAEFVGIPKEGNAVYATRNANGSPNYGGLERMAADLRTAATFGLSIVLLVAARGCPSSPYAAALRDRV